MVDLTIITSFGSIGVNSAIALGWIVKLQGIVRPRDSEAGNWDLTIITSFGSIGVNSHIALGWIVRLQGIVRPRGGDSEAGNLLTSLS